MYFLQRASNFVSSALRGLFSPFRRIQQSVRHFRQQNPVAQGQREMRSMTQRMNNTVSAPARMLRQMGIRADDLPQMPQRSAAEKNGFHTPEVGGTLAQYREQQLSAAKRRPQHAKRMLVYSQVHLVNDSSGERFIAHLGPESSSSIAEMQAYGVRLRFTQRSQSEQVALLTVSANPPAALTVDGRSDGQPLEVRSHSRLRLHDTELRVELIAQDDLSAVTQVYAAWETSTGPVRQDNQDAIGIYQHPGTCLFAVADGVGGGYAGDRMSAYAIQYLLKSFEYNLQRPPRWEDLLLHAFQNANLEIRHYIQNIPQHAGTTLTAVVIDNWAATVAHVGDSRLYLLRRGKLQQVTQDHARVMDVDSDNGVRTRTILARAVGKENNILPDVIHIELLPKDRLLLCTDGISNRVPPEEIGHVLQTQPASVAARSLVEMANARRNTDNASTIVIDIIDPAEQAQHWEAQPAPRVFAASKGHAPALIRLENSGEGAENRGGCTRWIVGLIVIALLAAAIFWLWNQRGSTPAQATASPTMPAITSTAADQVIEPASSPTAILIPATVEATVTLRVLPTTQPELSSPVPQPTRTPEPTAVFMPTSTVRPPNQ